MAATSSTHKAVRVGRQIMLQQQQQPAVVALAAPPKAQVVRVVVQMLRLAIPLSVVEVVLEAQGTLQQVQTLQQVVGHPAQPQAHSPEARGQDRLLALIGFLLHQLILAAISTRFARYLEWDQPQYQLVQTALGVLEYQTLHWEVVQICVEVVVAAPILPPAPLLVDHPYLVAAVEVQLPALHLPHPGQAVKAW